ncbi:hypothetical protein [Acidovorax sp. Leaf160]|uniref:hypothetical protein n=1 Tax=Acidovorax sp. Leaf160 TaxID=1736280 RepID=UPI000B0060CC|nr:hypothetical protein [Acidovorax sp. Leaf160]
MKKQPATPTRAAQAGRRMPADPENASPLRRQVLVAARRRCEDMQDGPDAREAMRREVMETPAGLLPDLLTALSTVRIDRTALFFRSAIPTERTNP